jgi:hypothetical protein
MIDALGRWEIEPLSKDIIHYSLINFHFSPERVPITHRTTHKMSITAATPNTARINLTCAFPDTGARARTSNEREAAEDKPTSIPAETGSREFPAPPAEIK